MADAWNLVAAWDHLAAAAYYLTGVARGSPPAAGAPPLRPPLPLPPYGYGHHHRGELGFEDHGGVARYGHHDLELGSVDHGGADALPPASHGHHRHHRRRHELDDDDSRGGGGDGGADVNGGGADVDDEDDDFAFGLHDLYHLVYPVVAAAPPYPAYKRLSEDAVETRAWAWFLFANAIVFTIAVTMFSVFVFRSSRRCLPIFLRAVVLALTVGAEIAAAIHLSPASHLATILSYISIGLHFFVYLMIWAVFCCRRRRVP